MGLCLEKRRSPTQAEIGIEDHVVVDDGRHGMGKTAVAGDNHALVAIRRVVGMEVENSQTDCRMIVKADHSRSQNGSHRLEGTFRGRYQDRGRWDVVLFPCWGSVSPGALSRLGQLIGESYLYSELLELVIAVGDGLNAVILPRWKEVLAEACNCSPPLPNDGARN